MRSICLVALVCVCVVTGSAAQVPNDCALVPHYAELAARPVATIDDYRKIESDFIGLNGGHITRVYRAPPSINIPATDTNFAAKAADLQKVAGERIKLMACP